jgi:hypothetical protein
LGIWADPKQRDTLIGLIRAAGAIRSQAAVPIMIKHLHYDAAEQDQTQVLIEEEFPAAGALIKIGIPAVPAILELAKSAPPRDVRPDPSVEKIEEMWARHDLTLRVDIGLTCLVQIYEQGGHGKMMARHLIEEEIKTAKPETAATLKKLLDWPALRVEEKK